MREKEEHDKRGGRVRGGGQRERAMAKCVECRYVCVCAKIVREGSFDRGAHVAERTPECTAEKNAELVRAKSSRSPS